MKLNTVLLCLTSVGNISSNSSDKDELLSVEVWRIGNPKTLHYKISSCKASLLLCNNVQFLTVDDAARLLPYNRTTSLSSRWFELWHVLWYLPTTMLMDSILAWFDRLKMTSRTCVIQSHAVISISHPLVLAFVHNNIDGFNFDLVCLTEDKVKICESRTIPLVIVSLR